MFSWILTTFLTSYFMDPMAQARKHVYRPFFVMFMALLLTRYASLCPRRHFISLDQLRVESRSIPKPSSNSTVDITTISSPHHIELTPADVGINDRLVVMELIKEIASSRPLDIGKAFGQVHTAVAQSSEKHAQFKGMVCEPATLGEGGDRGGWH